METDRGKRAWSETTRRDLLVTVALAGAALACGVTAACQSGSGLSDWDAPSDGALPVRMAGYPVDRVAALADGRIGMEGCRVSFESAGIGDLNSTAMDGDQRWEVQEIGLHPYMLAFANGRFRDYTLIPVFDAYSASKRTMYADLRNLGWVMNALPWFASELADTRALMGDNFWPYGIEENRKALEALFEYSHEQGFSERRLTIDELFHPSTMALPDEG